jgi:hypothetical protein
MHRTRDAVYTLQSDEISTFKKIRSELTELMPLFRMTAATFERVSPTSFSQEKLRERQDLQSWLGKSGQRAKWSFCLTAVRMAAEQEKR